MHLLFTYWSLLCNIYLKALASLNNKLGKKVILWIFKSILFKQDQIKLYNFELFFAFNLYNIDKYLSLTSFNDPCITLIIQSNRK